MNKISRPEVQCLKLFEQELLLLPEKAMVWPSKSALIVSDLHMGKAGHFRKAGIPVPGKIHLEELFVLDALLAEYKIQKMIFLGDLFHSHMNNEWHLLSDWLSSYQEVAAVLVKGNHDILSEINYLTCNLKVVDELRMGPFSFSHEKIESSLFNISGHVHPAIKLKGVARQGLRLPCFYFSKDHALMPAFGNFTGASKIRPGKYDQVFVVAENQVLKVT